MAKVTGLGGVFYVVSDFAATRLWYKEKLGIDGDYRLIEVFDNLPFRCFH